MPANGPPPAAGDPMGHHGWMSPPGLLLIAVLAMVALHVQVPVATLPMSAARWLGLVPLGVGVAVNLVADRAFHRAGTPVQPSLPSTALLTDGVFAWTRNPMYLGFVLILVGLWALLGSASPGAMVILYAIVADRVFVPPEEARLTQRFGEAYESYARRVRRWL